MCGIAGYLGRAPAQESVIRRMTRKLAHRGPDAEGFHFDRELALGHRRLSIIDIEGSRQPMTSTDGRFTVVFNGEIYNFAALRDELEQAGCMVRTRGDTEVLLHGYATFGAAILRKLEGMFAFAIWDARERSLFVARDHFGVKPLYYFWDERTFVFGSELKALLEHPEVDSEIDLDALGLYIECQYIPSPRSAYRRIMKLEAAHALLLRERRLEKFQYWRLDYSRKQRAEEPDTIEALERSLRRSVEAMLVADVPLGCFLSGGIDSSLVAALARDISGRAIDTFHLGFACETPSNEHVEAAAVAEHIGSRHHVLLLEPSSLLSAFDAWIDIFDEPFGDPAALPTMLLSRMAREHATVVLTGEGADEILGGYDNYQKRTSEERLTRVLGAPFSPLRHLVPLLPPLLRRDRVLRPIGEPPARRYATIPNIFDRAVLPSVMTETFWRAQSSTIVDFAERQYEECNSPDYIEKIMHVDARLWLVDDLLTKVDRATMSVSLEARVPYLDHLFVEDCARLEPRWKRNGAVGKYIVKKIAERYLPPSLIHRRKQGFTLPLNEWLAGPLRKEVDAAIGTSFARRRLVRPAYLRRLLEQQWAGRNHTGKIWNLLILEKWLARYAPGLQL